MSYHATNSSHVTDHLLSSLLSLSYMCCVACCWKSRLTPAVLYWKTPAVSVSLLPRRPPRRAAPSAPAARSRPHVGPLYCASVYSCSLFVRRSTCRSYRIVSYRDILSDIVSYLSFLANVNSSSCSLFVIVRPSVCRLSVVCRL